MLAALHVTTANPRARIVIAVKGLIGQSGCTRMVQGGYNCVLNSADSFDKHFDDTIRGGQFLNNQELAWALVNDSPDRIIELENRIGCLFDRNADGTIHQKPFAGQSFDRTVHKGDLTGIEIMSNLRDWVFEQPNVTVLEETRGLDFLTAGSRVVGAVLLDNRRGRFIAVTAKATLSATGAGATMYHISSPSLEKAADGQAMAARARRRVRRHGDDAVPPDRHPRRQLDRHRRPAWKKASAAPAPDSTTPSASATWRRYAPDKLERATRDVVSRSGYMEIMAGRGTAQGGVLIDATHIPNVAKHFAGMVDRCREYGFDLVNDRVEVSPSSHYHMGGIRIDVNCHTNIEGLFAAGEDAGGVHGANRLGGNGVADSIVFGARAGDTMAEYIASARYGAAASAAEVCKPQVQEICTRWLQPARTHHRRKPVPTPRPHGARDVDEGRRRPQRQGHARKPSPKSKKSASESNTPPAHRPLPSDERGIANPQLSTLNPQPSTLSTTPPGTKPSTPKTSSFIAEMLTRSALAREESRGAHYRSDFPTQKLDWLKNIRMSRCQTAISRRHSRRSNSLASRPQELKEHREAPA